MFVRRETLTLPSVVPYILCLFNNLYMPVTVRFRIYVVENFKYSDTLTIFYATVETDTHCVNVSSTLPYGAYPGKPAL